MIDEDDRREACEELRSYKRANPDLGPFTCPRCEGARFEVYERDATGRPMRVRKCRTCGGVGTVTAI